LAHFGAAPHNQAMRLSLGTFILASVCASAVCGCGAPPPPPEQVMALGVPAEPASIGPNIAKGPQGTLVLSWIEPTGDGHALRYSVLDDGAWASPRTVATGQNWFVNWADFPSVVPLSESLWAAHWLVSWPEGGYAYDVNIALSGDDGATWSEPVRPHFDGTPTEHGFVTLYPDSGGLGLVWLDGRKMINEYDENDITSSGMTLRAATFGEDLLPIREALVDDLTCDCCQTDVAITSDGPVVAYRDRTTSEIRDILVSRREFGEWQPGVPVAHDHWEIPACPVNGPIIKAHMSKVAVIWFSAAGDRPVVKVAWSDDGAKSFAAPIEVDTERPLGHVGGVLLPDGDLIVSWHRSAGNGGAELLLRRVSPSGAIGDVFALEAAADIFAISVPQVALYGTSIIVVWTTAIDGAYGVASALVPLSQLN
jgi:hypothetical protein